MVDCPIKRLGHIAGGLDGTGAVPEGETSGSISQSRGRKDSRHYERIVGVPGEQKRVAAAVSINLGMQDDFNQPVILCRLGRQIKLEGCEDD